MPHGPIDTREYCKTETVYCVVCLFTPIYCWHTFCLLRRNGQAELIWVAGTHLVGLP